MKKTPSWMFGITSIPYGVYGAFTATLLPFLFANAKISLQDIGWYGTATLIPTWFNFLYAPVVDLGMRRRSWLVLAAVLSGACLGAAVLQPLPSGKMTFAVFTFVGQVLNGLISSANGGLMATTLDDRQRGKAGGWYNAGNLGGGAIGAGLILGLLDRLPRPQIALLLMAVTVLPALAAFAIDEPPARKDVDAREHAKAMLRDIWNTARSRPGWTGMLFCISPVGTAALLNYFAAMANTFHAEKWTVVLVNGWLNGLITAAGSVLGGLLCDRIDRRLAYLLSGALTALVGVGMAISPINGTTYAVGVCIYFFVAGFCYAAFSAVVLEAVGKAGASASAQYALFVAAGNIAITYVGFIDTRFENTRHLLGADAGLNLLGVVVLGVVVALVYRKKPAPPNQAMLQA
jgi:MFS transporter, PAT family, beta-lactamase induction signal transducer AmpG